MILKYNMHQRLVPSLLSLSLFLQSCGGFSNSLIPRESKEKEPTYIIPSSTKQITNIKHSDNKEFLAKGNHVVAFYEHQGKLRANVNLKPSNKLFTGLEVTIAPDIDLQQLTNLPPQAQERLIHIQLSKNNQPGRVVVFKEGLRGGMWEGEGDPKSKEKEKEQDLITGDSSHSNFPSSLPYISEQEIEIHLNKQLGAGSFGIVHQATYRGKTVAAKKLINTSQEQVESFQREVGIMANLRHDNLVTLLGFCSSQNALIMEYVSQGTLADFLKNLKNEEDTRWQLRYRIGLDIAKGIAYLHKQNIVHGDLKSNNILLDSNWRAKIADFGCSRLKSENSTYGYWGGTVCWTAPEIFITNRNTKAADVYSYGMILWYLGARKQPFATLSPFQIAKSVTEGDREVVSEDTPVEIREVIESCWLPEPTSEKEVLTQRRPTMEQIQRQLEKSRSTFLNNEDQGLDYSLEKKQKKKKEKLKSLKHRLERLEEEREQQNKLLNRLLQLEEDRKKEEKEKEKEIDKSYRLGLESILSLLTGSIISFAGKFAPNGWLLCDGKPYSSLVYPELYNVIGATYVPDNEKSIIEKYNQSRIEKTFHVPDLRGRVIVGVDTGIGRVSLNNMLGESGGEEKHLLDINEIPPHDHTFEKRDDTSNLVGSPNHSTSPLHFSLSHTSSVGGGQPHNNMQPYLVLNYIINAGKKNQQAFEQSEKLDEREKKREDN